MFIEIFIKPYLLWNKNGEENCVNCSLLMILEASNGGIVKGQNFHNWYQCITSSLICIMYDVTIYTVPTPVHSLPPATPADRTLLLTNRLWGLWNFKRKFRVYNAIGQTMRRMQPASCKHGIDCTLCPFQRIKVYQRRKEMTKNCRWELWKEFLSFDNNFDGYKQHAIQPLSSKETKTIKSYFRVKRILVPFLDFDFRLHMTVETLFKI